MALLEPGALERLAEAFRGFLEYTAEQQAIINREPDPLETTVNYLRTVPAGDTMKKEALANFFNTEAGSKYTRGEREQAYNDLLGRERNKENMG